ncbi:MAG: motility associated factor glycosyltransferase family protein [Desulfuromonadales bacterium]|nr:motility associated factor glycosyltransferase family protein [Desulfuromonadales bacterium]
MDNKIGVGPFLVNSFGDRYLYEVNGSAFDKVGSEISFSKHFGKDLFEKNSLYVIAGSDSGLLPQYLVKQGLPEGSYYIFIELPAVIDRLKEIIPERGFHKKIIMATADEWLLRAKEIEFQNFVYLGNLKFSLSFAATDGHYSDYLELSNHLQEELEKIRWGLNAELGAELFHQRQLENLPENRLSAVHLHGTFNGKTAIVLAGGPSLDAVLPWVIENRHCFVVIAVSRIARRLLEVDISPDIIVSVDPNQISFDISKEMLKLWERTIFVNKYHVVSTLLGQWCGRCLFLGPRVPWESSLNENTIDSPGPTVTNSAIDLAVKMGFAQVLLAGVDLCYSRDGYTHAQGSNERQVGPQLGEGLMWVETNGGGMAETTPDLHFAAAQIGAQAVRAKQQYCRIVNLSEGATKMNEVEYASLAEVKLDLMPRSDCQIILEMLSPDTVDERVNYYQTALSELIRAENAFREIKKLSNAALKANDAFFGKRDGGKGKHKYKVKMDRIEKKLKNDFPAFSTLVKKFGIRGFLKLTQGDRDRDWDQNDVERLGRVYYEAYRDSAGRLLEMVGNAAERLRVRLEEEQEQPDFQRLIEHWKKDLQPGRCIVWKNNHPRHSIPEEYVEQFTTLEREFDETLLLQETAHLKRTRSWSQLGRVRGKLMVMYKQNQTENLCHLVNNLTQLDGAEALSLACLGRGYLAELENEPDRALAEYQQLLDVQEGEQNLSILEDALRRLLRLSLQGEDYANARLVAECLAGISVIYLPYYADLLWLLDEKRSALDAYTDYLEKVPNDHAVMIKLGRYYLKLGLLDGARMMFEVVIEQDSSNAAAKILLDEVKKS